MGLLLVESFDWLGTGMTGTELETAFDRKCTAVELISGDDATTVAGIGGNGTALRTAETAHKLEWKLDPTPAATDEVGMGIWFRSVGITAGFLNQFILMGFVDSDKLRFHMNLRILDENKFAIFRSNTKVETLPLTIVRNQWYFVEMNTVVNNTTGSWEVRIDGVSIFSDTSIDTSDGGNGVISHVQIRGIDNGLLRTDFAGVIAWDNTGGDLTDFPGPISFRTIHPDADGDDEAWTTSSGTDSFALVNETAPHDDDTDYLQDTVSTNRSLFTYDDLSTNYSGVIGVQINTVVRETDASDFTLINTFKQGGTLYPESSQAIAGQTYENLSNVLDLDPDTSVAWIITGINSLQAGIEVG